MVYALEIKGQQARILTAERTKTGPLCQLIFRKRRQATAPAFRLCKIDFLQPFQRGAEADNAGDVGRPGFKPPGGGLGFKAIE